MNPLEIEFHELSWIAWLAASGYREHIDVWRGSRDITPFSLIEIFELIFLSIFFIECEAIDVKWRL